MAQAGHVIGMAVGQHNEIQLRQVDIPCLHVGREDLGIVARVEQDALARHLDQR